jgi:hypothetical protein
MSTLKEQFIQAPPELSYTSVPMNALKSILIDRLNYKIKRSEFRSRQISRFIRTTIKQTLEMSYAVASKTRILDKRYHDKCGSSFL